MQKRTRPIGIDLFAGAGGLSLGFERAGFDVVAAVEMDPIHCATHAYNFPYCRTICRSVADISGDEIRRLAAIDNRDVDVLFGGAPCQGFSLIGKRALDDPRNALVYHFVRLVAEIEPAYFVFENVRGLTIGDQCKFLDELISAFGEVGYNVVLPYEVLNARNYGVPQDRQRLFLMGARRDMSLPEYPEPCGREVNVREALDDLPEADDFPELKKSDRTRATFGPPSAYARKLRGLDNDADDYGYKRDFDPELLTASLRTGHTEKSRRRFAATAHGATEPVSRFFKLDPDSVCNTLRAGTASDRGAFTSPRPIHPYSPRCITNREAARLHSYPDWFQFHTTKWHGFRQIGNSVPPLLAEAVAAEIREAMGAVPERPEEVVTPGPATFLEFSMGEAAGHYGVPDDTIPKRTRGKTRRRSMPNTGGENRYKAIIEKIFFDRYEEGATELTFDREEIVAAANELGVNLPKNVGDVVYSVRYRSSLPETVLETQPEGKEWIIEGIGKSRYVFRLVTLNRIEPREDMVARKIPDSTPEIISAYALNDEQALLAVVRYNRLIDIFLGLTSFSLQNHLRTTLKQGTQIEIDEIYVGLDRHGCHYIIPVQAKGGSDRISVVQTRQDVQWCREKYPGIVCKAISAQFMADDLIALFELTLQDDEIKVADERHYKLVPATELDENEIRNYAPSEM